MSAEPALIAALGSEHEQLQVAALSVLALLPEPTSQRSIAYVAILAPVLTLAILALLKLLFGNLSATAEGEHEGLDLSEHSESAYVG